MRWRAKTGTATGTGGWEWLAASPSICFMQICKASWSNREAEAVATFERYHVFPLRQRLTVRPSPYAKLQDGQRQLLSCMRFPHTFRTLSCNPGSAFSKTGAIVPVNVGGWARMTRFSIRPQDCPHILTDVDCGKQPRSLPIVTPIHQQRVALPTGPGSFYSHTRRMGYSANLESWPVTGQAIKPKVLMPLQPRRPIGSRRHPAGIF